MPELPEVETIVQDLKPLLEGQQISAVSIEWPGVLDDVPVENFRQVVVGRTIQSLARRGKYIIVRLSENVALTIHLRMTGKLLLRSSGSPPDRFVRAALTLGNGSELRFADTRKFGRIRLVDEEAISNLDRRLGPEPLSSEFTATELAQVLKGRGITIKALLLDQRSIAGLGNIYADEALFLAGIHPTRQAGSLSVPEVVRLHGAIRQVLTNSIANRGTTFDSYRDGFGVPGGNQRALCVYQRHGQPCLQCGATLQRLEVAGRGTHVCPRCQPAPSGEMPRPARTRRPSRIARG